MADRAYSAAKAEWESALSRWQREASETIFKEKTKELEKACSELADIPSKRQRGIVKLESEREDRQRQRYLDRFRIDRSEIRGIGASRTSMLASYGIETAADIHRTKIKKIPGFGETLTSELVKWRKAHEQNFRFNPHEPIDRRDVAILDRNLESQRASLVGLLRQGPDQLRRISHEIGGARIRLTPLLERAWNQLKIAEATIHSL
jgi:DNA-binding helix-hairpin-helix protein with protein kinase domain